MKIEGGDSSCREEETKNFFGKIVKFRLKTQSKNLAIFGFGAAKNSIFGHPHNTHFSHCFRGNWGLNSSFFALFSPLHNSQASYEGHFPLFTIENGHFNFGRLLEEELKVRGQYRKM